MSTTYQDFLERLRAERISRQWTQQQMGHKLRMDQSHYSKAEAGHRRFTYYELLCLCESGFDSHYIFTGCRSNSEYEEFLIKSNYDELTCYLNILYGLIRYCYKRDNMNLCNDLYKRVEYMHYVILQSKNDNVFLVVRRLLNYNQKKMSELLGVDIKKFREMEKGANLPDSEIILRMYELFHIPVFAFIRDKNMLVAEICYLLKVLESNLNRPIFDYIKDFHNILQTEE